MSFGREHLYNKLFGGDVIVSEPCKPCETYDYTIDHINCKKECCVSKVKPVNDRKCLRSCCNLTKQRTRCSSAYCPICDTCGMCYCYCDCYCYHACHVGCADNAGHNGCPLNEVVDSQPFKNNNYYCNPYYVMS